MPESGRELAVEALLTEVPLMERQRQESARRLPRRDFAGPFVALLDVEVPDRLLAADHAWARAELRGEGRLGVLCDEGKTERVRERTASGSIRSQAHAQRKLACTLSTSHTHTSARVVGEAEQSFLRALAAKCARQ